MNIESVVRWYRNGEEYADGVQLLKLDGLDVTTFLHPSAQKYQLLKIKLFATAGCNEFDIISWTGDLTETLVESTIKIDIQEDKPIEILPNQNTYVARKTCRELYPSIDWNTAPDEVKLLFSNQITSYYNFRDAHIELQNLEECEQARILCKTVIENVTKNRMYIQQLQYYNDHGKLLKPKIGKREKMVQEVLDGGDKLEISKLLLRSSDAIKDTEREIKKGDKPELNQSRNETIARNETIIARCNALLL